ncbi:MAG: cytochrome c [Gammaproteobacteria bacterium]|nr:cytochrome c [Gammaproteobacteria bacterium]MCP4091477.1 cytochrome c [Gammaproteobacteria bacterium]MCP4275387.1 cytochrome c [Gammaproteobacteria bacterium]MCP4832275.1 cytochrome c [Gammaproteobacteria bacterium]MCP4928150.1 cytochrome c [Gammaproteobacteria bacterium]
MIGTTRKQVLGLLISGLLVSGAYADEAERVSALEADNCFPRGELRGDINNGKALHYEHCVACHGLTGQADVVVMHMDETPPDQSDPEYMQTLSDGYLYIAICRGGEGVGKSYVMSPWGDFFTDQEIKDMVAWVRTFSDT